MPDEGQLQVWWHCTKGKQDRPEAQDVGNNMMGARAVKLAHEREGHHFVRVMRKTRGRWVQLTDHQVSHED